MFHVSGKNLTGNEKFQGNIYLKPEELPEDRWFFIVNSVMSPCELYEILSGFSFHVSKFSHLSNVPWAHTFREKPIPGHSLSNQHAVIKF